MSLWRSITNLFHGRRHNFFLFLHEGESMTDRDTLAAINSLKEVVRGAPDAVGAYLALGNLYRARGDLERAIQIRNSIVVRSDLSDDLKARAYFEMGLDYKRGGFMDRALAAFEHARRWGGPSNVIGHEVAMLYAASGNFQEAAAAYGRLGHKVAEAYYLTCLGEEYLRHDNPGQALSVAKKALRVYPPSPEAWLARLIYASRQGKWREVAKLYNLAWNKIAPESRFLFLEGLLNELDRSFALIDKETAAPEPETETASTPEKNTETPVPATPDNMPENNAPTDNVSDLDERKHAIAADWCKVMVDSRKPLPEDTDILTHYYQGMFLMRAGRLEEAGLAFEKALIVDPEFWAARMERVAITLQNESVTPYLREQIGYFLAQGRQNNRFICKVCGLRQNVIFFACPKCRSWHSAMFRRSLKN